MYHSYLTITCEFVELDICCLANVVECHLFDREVGFVTKLSYILPVIEKKNYMKTRTLTTLNLNWTEIMHSSLAQEEII